MSTSFDVAHFREQGVDLVLVWVNSSFGHKPAQEKASVCSTLQAYSNSAGLAGTVVPVWDSGGRLGFYAPQLWHPFFRGLALVDVACNINRKLICN
jgi:hypothetical protein